MTHVRRFASAKKKRREVPGSARGYRGQRSHLYCEAKEQMLHSKAYEFRGHRHRKGQFRHLWIQYINAVVHANDITCNRFVQDLNLAGVGIGREDLAELTANGPQAFVALVKVAKDVPPEDANAPATK